MTASVLAVSNEKFGRVDILNELGELLYHVGEGTILKPSSVSFSEDGNMLIVVDCLRHQILVFSIPNGELLSRIGKYGKGNGEFKFPYDICVDMDTVFVCDNDNDRVCVLRLSIDGTLSFIRSFGNYGSAKECFKVPHYICLTPSKNLIVTDMYNYRVMEVTQEGKHIRFFGNKDIVYPTGVAIDPRGRVWVSHCGQRCILVFSKTGVLINSIGNPKMFGCIGSIKFDIKNEMVFVSDTTRNCIHVLKYNDFIYNIVEVDTLLSPEPSYISLLKND